MITFSRDPWENPDLERLLRAEGWKVTVRGEYLKARKTTYDSGTKGNRRGNLFICTGHDPFTCLYFVGYSDNRRKYLYNFPVSPSGKKGLHTFFMASLCMMQGLKIIIGIDRYLNSKSRVML